MTAQARPPYKAIHNVPPELWRQVKSAAALRGISTSEYVILVLTQAVREREG